MELLTVLVFGGPMRKYAVKTENDTTLMSLMRYIYYRDLKTRNVCSDV